MTIKKHAPAAKDSKGTAMTPEAEAAIRFISELHAAGIGGGVSPAVDTLLVSTLVAAGLVGVKQQTLAIWRCEPNHKRALPYTTVGRRVFYYYGDIRRFIERNMVMPKVAA